jgi:hypothetical protein
MKAAAYRFLIGSILVAASAAAAAAPAPVTSEEFVERCKTDGRFCRTQIMAVEALLERNRKACLPARVSKDAMAAKVQDTIEDIIDEVPDFKMNPYRAIVEQIIMLNWPCEPIS